MTPLQNTLQDLVRQLRMIGVIGDIEILVQDQALTQIATELNKNKSASANKLLHAAINSVIITTPEGTIKFNRSR